MRNRGYRLGIVSNAWPSLDRGYRSLGLRHFFDAFVVSARLGYLKPDARIYRQAIDEIGLQPSQLLFVDDAPENVHAAISLGLTGIVMARDRRPPPGDLPWIGSLDDLEPLLGMADASSA